MRDLINYKSHEGRQKFTKLPPGSDDLFDVKKFVEPPSNFDKRATMDADGITFVPCGGLPGWTITVLPTLESGMAVK